jgi:hypothetical protein
LSIGLNTITTQGVHFYKQLNTNIERNNQELSTGHIKSINLSPSDYSALLKVEDRLHDVHFQDKFNNLPKSNLIIQETALNNILDSVESIKLLKIRFNNSTTSSEDKIIISKNIDYEKLHIVDYSKELSDVQFLHNKKFINAGTNPSEIDSILTSIDNDDLNGAFDKINMLININGSKINFIERLEKSNESKLFQLNNYKDSLNKINPAEAIDKAKSMDIQFQMITNSISMIFDMQQKFISKF